jgi:transcriptional regulator with GAF, ATPase, and Fis domain
MTRAETPTLFIAKTPGDDHILVKKAKLLVVTGSLQGREFMVDRDVFTIGAGQHNDLALTDDTISRSHAEIELTPTGHVVRDLGSTNGTFIHGVRITEAYLGQGTEIQMGQTKLIFCPLQEVKEYMLSQKTAIGALLGQSVAMRRVFHQVETYAPTDATILIEGETGTGKEIVAEEIHALSRRAGKPFIVIDCTALAKELIESELFGHKKGAFTGANADRVGAFEQANGGTIFLDEVADLGPDLQPKLLRVLEKREVRPVGSNVTRKVDVRILSATNKKLVNEVNAGRFREDLFFRLSVAQIELPPLRRRKDDIPMLTRKFLQDFHGPNALEDVVNFDKTMDVFRNYDWPGNVRELRNLVEIASVSGRRPMDLSAFLYLGRVRTEERATAAADFLADRPFKDAKNDLVRRFESDYVRDLLARHKGNVSRAAREAGIERAYLQRLIRKHDLRT